MKHPSLPYIVPFAVFVVFLILGEHLSFMGIWEYPFRDAVLALTLWFCSRHVLDFRIHRWIGTIAIGAIVFLVWIAPDMLFPGYRTHWLFQNSLTGEIKSSLPEPFRTDPIVLIFRLIRAVILVPIIEELFWRAWMMRWLINPDFQRVPLGAYTRSSMLITAALFASEHGPYWEVGLIAGFVYNWWMVRTRSLGDCILAHAITNGCLSAFVITHGQWQYWM